VLSVAFSPDRRRLASGSWGHLASGSHDQTVKVWDASTGQDLLTLKGHTNGVSSVAFSPDGRRIASGSFDRTVKVWDAKTGQGLLTLQRHTDSVVDVAFSPDGRRIASGSHDQTVKVWDASTGQDLLTLKGHTNGVRSVAYSPDGRLLASGSEDKTVKVWDASTGEKLFSLPGHTSYVYSVAFSPEGRRIASGSWDDTVKVWDAWIGPDLLTLKGHRSWVTRVAFSRDGTRIVSRDQSAKVLSWDAASGRLLPAATDGPPAGRSTVAVYGHLRVRADGVLLRLERLPSPDEQRRLQQDEARIVAILRDRASRDFHTAEAESAQMRRQPFAAVFHLDRLLPLLPEQRHDLLARRYAVLAAALKADAKDAWAARALARQAVGDPDSLPDRQTLLTARASLRQRQDSPHDRHHGALLLRTGSAREATLVLRAAIRRRPMNAPPVEEMLLALAHARLNQRAQAVGYLRTAVAWMRPATEPVRAASLSGLGATNLLAALASVALRQPDPRLDHQTNRELLGLRAEVEEALAGKKR
jgi:hypothetical protein